MEEICFVKKNDFQFITDGIKEICRIEHEQIEDKDLLINNIHEAIVQNRIIGFYSQKKIIGFIEFIFSKKQPYGINYEDEKNEFCWINNMFVQKEYRKNGIGKKLFVRLEQICKEKGVKKIMFDVFDVNNNAKKFYDSRDYKTKLRIMEKQL